MKTRAKVIHLNTGTLCPFGGQNTLGHDHLICHCLLVESDDHLILVDSGLGLNNIQQPEQTLGPSFLKMARPKLKREETAISQIRALGLDPKDVRHIVLTHLDVDHAGGVSDFPWAKVHLFEPEWREALTPGTYFSRKRYRPLSLLKERDPKTVQTYPLQGERWYGLESIRLLPIPALDILLVPLEGHSVGHSGVALKDGGRWTLHAGDAYFHHHELLPGHPREKGIPFALTAYQKFFSHDDALRRHNLERLQTLKRIYHTEVDIICSHDPSGVSKFSL